MDSDDDGLSIVQASDFQFGSSGLVCASGVIGLELWRLEGSCNRSLGDDCIILCCQAGRIASVSRGTSTDGIGISEANRTVGRALLWLAKLPILDRRIR
jgi:hypothetical protein